MQGPARAHRGGPRGGDAEGQEGAQGQDRVGVRRREAQDGAGDERDARPAAEREEGRLGRHGGGGRGEEARHQPDQADGEHVMRRSPRDSGFNAARGPREGGDPWSTHGYLSCTRKPEAVHYKSYRLHKVGTFYPNPSSSFFLSSFL